MAGCKNPAMNMHVVLRMPTAGAAALMSVLLLVGCAHQSPPPGQSREQVLQKWGRPTATYDLKGSTATDLAISPANKPGMGPTVVAGSGSERLEYATGPFGRTTWMIDLDADGRVVAAQQVLNEARFIEVQQTVGLRSDGLLRLIGTPGERRAGGLAGGQVWSWRYPNNDCLWFQASVADSGYVTSAGYGGDPLCDRGADFARGDRARGSPR